MSEPKNEAVVSAKKEQPQTNYSKKTLWLMLIEMKLRHIELMLNQMK